MDSPTTAYNTKKYRLFIGGALVVVLAIGALAFYFLTRNYTQEPLDEQKEAREIKPLGSDPVALLIEAEKRQKTADYYVEYDVMVTNPHADERHSTMRVIEKKWHDYLRIDSYLGAARVNSIIQNGDGVFGCNIAENSKESPCYKLPVDMGTPDLEKTAGLSNEVFSDLIKSGAVVPKMILGKEVSIADTTRVCDGFEYVFTGEALDENGVAVFSRRLVPDISSDDIADAKNALSAFSVESSLCFDRETGVPLVSSTSATVGTTTERYSRTAITFFPRAEFSHTLTLKPLIEKDETDSYFHGQNRLGEFAIDDEFLYIGGKSGVFTIKNGEIISQEKVPGGVDAIEVFGGVPYAANDSGVYVRGTDGWKEELKVSYAGDFEIFHDELYAATFYGVFVRRNGAWVQPNETFKKLEWTDALSQSGGFLYATNKDGGLYMLDGDEWRLLQEVNPYKQSQRFRKRGEHLFLLKGGDLFELRGGDILPVSTYASGASVNDLEALNGKIYIGGYRGVYVAGEGFISDEKATGEISDFVVYRGSLYMAGETAVYRLDNGMWRIVGSPYSFTRPIGLAVLDGILYGFGPVGVSRLDEDVWVSTDIMGVSHFISHGGRIYAVSFNKGMLHEVISTPNDQLQTFALPPGAKIITFPQ